MRTSRIAIAGAILAALFPGPARAQSSAPDAGIAWEPMPASEPVYGTQAPTVDPANQRVFIEGYEGTDIFIETWLPAEKDGRIPPEEVPTILISTPYVKQGTIRYGATRIPPIIEYFTERGYAVSQQNVRGTGESGGCLEQTAEAQWTDGAHVIEWLGRDAPWSNGNVGMYGRSYDAETQISTAGYADPAQISYLKALVPIASVGSQYDWNYMDGVPWEGQPAGGNAGYLLTSASPGNTSTSAPQRFPEKLLCQPDVMANSANQTGDYLPYWKARDYRAGAENITAATLYVHGLRDFNVQDITIAGWFDRLPETTPHKGLFGVWEHATPGSQSVARDWERADFLAMTTAWFDRYLKGVDTGVEEWPAVQVQSSDGQWWEVPEFPTTGGPIGQLALGPGGTLGVTEPTGSSSFTERRTPGNPGDGESLVFETAPVTEPLHLTGQPMLDLWVSSNLPDAHIGAELELIGPDGEPMTAPNNGEHATYGVRSLMHIDPMPDGWFVQELGKPFPIDTPTSVTVRLLPTDLVVPPGGWLRLTLAGTVDYDKGTSLLSGLGSTITVHHDCTHPSALRFRIPDPDAPLLNVREKDEIDPLTSDEEARIGVRDGAGLASAHVCGAAPVALPFQ